jgi:hypothetical protein
VKRALLIGTVLTATFLGYSARERVAGREKNSGLQLSTEIVRQRYCTGDDDLDGVSLTLKLHYQNLGQEPLILQKDSSLAYYIVVRDSPTGNIETFYDLEWITDGPLKLDDSSLNEAFVILQPQGRFEIETEVRVFAIRDDATNVKGGILSGDHYLQVTIQTGDNPAEVANRLRQKWRSHGLLWTDSVTSLPMKFQIAKNRTVSNCK